MKYHIKGFGTNEILKRKKLNLKTHEKTDSKEM